MKLLKNKRKFIALMCSIILAFTMIDSTGVMGSTESTKTMNKFNVVFVTDTSGSMKSTDPNEYRFEAIDLFVGLITNGGNMVGSVVFGDGVVSELDLTEVKSKPDKLNITNDIRSQDKSGWTDIGGALMAAVDMLKQNGKKELPSIVILLTDGNTEMATDELTQESIENKENALEIARDEGYNIYTICLNKNKTANLTELKQIASATGGQFQEVTDAADLQSVFDLYYQMIYSTQSEKLVDERIPDNGILSREFHVADVGVEEVNIVVFGDVNKCVLTPPNGMPYTDAQIEDISYVAKTFRILKVIDPEPGVWNLDAHGKSGSTIKVFKIYNPNLQVKASIKNPQDSYMKGKPIDFIAQIYEADQKVTDIGRYAGYKATLEVKQNGSVVKTIEASEATTEGFELSYTPEDYGTYYATINISNNEIYSTSEEFSLNVGNTPPVVKKEVLQKHINIWPFLIKTDSSIDLKEAASDAEDKTLNYKIVSSTWLEDDYTLDGSIITIDNFSVSKGSFKVEAYDSQGAFGSFDVKVTSTNIGMLAMILMLIGGLIALAVILLVTHKNKLYAFMGQIEVENFETGDRATFEKSRGQIKLTCFQIGNTGFEQKKCYFQATGKKHIYFIAKKPFTSDSAFGKIKKIKIDSNCPVRIYSDESQTRGILVTFESVLNNMF